ncbi:MAG: fumarylacetoacetase [Pseudomonadota bacterium]
MANATLNHTHDPAARSWVEAANAPGGDFPVQNLPLAIFHRASSGEPLRGGCAIGDRIVDLAALARTGLLSGDAQAACEACAQPALNAYFALGATHWRALRHALFDLLCDQAPAATQERVRACLVAQSDAHYGLPARIGDYTDFYTSIHHAINVGRLIFPDNPLTPNFQWLPIAYHGRASSVRVGQPGFGFRRPMGQAMPPGAAKPAYGPCARLDFELEMGFFIGPGNTLGEPIPLAEAEQHIAGMVLLNDWSARDHQFWEMSPLGPFLGKNFCTTVSPWVVSLEALAPYRVPFARPAADPQPLPYLDGDANRAGGGIDVQLEVRLDTPAHRERGLPPSAIARTSFRHQYWTVAQMVAQHTVGGCDLQPGDLLGTGTVSGPTAEEAGALVELSKGGRAPVALAGTGEQRGFLEDGDTVILRGWCEQDGAARIGFGECRGVVLPAQGG